MSGVGTGNPASKRGLKRVARSRLRSFSTCWAAAFCSGVSAGGLVAGEGLPGAESCAAAATGAGGVNDGSDPTTLMSSTSPRSSTANATVIVPRCAGDSEPVLASASDARP